MAIPKPILWAVALAVLGLAGALRRARAQQGCYNETCATSSETLSVCNGGCVITVPTYGSYGTYNEDYISECVQCGSELDLRRILLRGRPSQARGDGRAEHSSVRLGPRVRRELFRR